LAYVGDEAVRGDPHFLCFAEKLAGDTLRAAVDDGCD